MKKHASTNHEKRTGRRRIAVAALDLGFRATGLIRSVLALTFCIAGGLPVLGQTAEPMKTIVPIHLDASTGAITVGSTVYPITAPGTPGTGMHLLALKRQPDRTHLDAPEVIQDQTFMNDFNSARRFLQEVRSSNPDALLIVNAVGLYGFLLSDVGPDLEQFGAPDLSGQPYTVAYVLIGNGGLHMGQAAQRGYSTLNLDGYLAKDTNGNYTFIQTDYIRYDIGVDGTIKIGNTTYPVANAVTKVGPCDSAASNSLHLVVVDRVTPDTRYFDNAYCGGLQTSFDSLASTLNSLGDGNLVFIASNGNPVTGERNFGTDGDTRVVKLAQAVANLGGYYETIVYMGPSDTYSLVSGAAPTVATPGARKQARESSSVYPDSPTGELHGVLARDKPSTEYSPLNADPSGLANLDLYDLLAQTPIPFPNPATSDELTAFQYIAEKLCKSKSCNVRNQYANTNISMDVYNTDLAIMRSPDNKDCNDSDNASLPFCIVRQQLMNEFEYVLDIRAFHDNLKSLWLASGTTSILSMLSAYNDIQATLNAPSAAPAPNLVNPIVGFFLGLAGFIPEVGPLFGLADTAFNLATSLTTDPSGNPTVSLTSTVGQLQQQAIQQFESQGTTTATQFDLIYQDWGKIQALGTVLAQAQPGDDWYWDDDSTGQILQAMAPAISASYYQSLMPAVYAVGRYVPGCNGDVFDQDCENHYWGNTPIFQQPRGYIASNSAQTCCNPFMLDESGGNRRYYMPYTYPTDPNNIYQNPSTAAYTQGHSTILADGAWLGMSLKTTGASGNQAGYYDPPDESVLSNLFTPLSKGGLGVYRPAFYEGWPFSRVICGTSGVYPYQGPGCDWSTGAPAAETLQTPLSSVAIRIAGLERVGSTVNVTLKVINNGTVVAKGVEISNVSLRALGGSGQAVLMGPVLPIKIGELIPTGSDTVVLQLGIAPDVTKLTITEAGSIDSGRREPSRFSLAQVIFPQTVK